MKSVDSILFLSVPVPLVDFQPLNSQSVRKALTFVNCPVRISQKFLLEEAKLVVVEAGMINFLFHGALFNHDWVSLKLDSAVCGGCSLPGGVPCVVVLASLRLLKHTLTL